MSTRLQEKLDLHRPVGKYDPSTFGALEYASADQCGDIPVNEAVITLSRPRGPHRRREAGERSAAG